MPTIEQLLSKTTHALAVYEAAQISQLIARLKEQLKTHGDLKVFYASSYDWCLPIEYAEVEEDPGWENAPKKKALYIQ